VAFEDVDATAAFVAPGGTVFYLHGGAKTGSDDDNGSRVATGLSFRNVSFSEGPDGRNGSLTTAWDCASVAGEAAGDGSVTPWPPCDLIDVV
jgi:hypothetical protein